MYLISLIFSFLILSLSCSAVHGSHSDAHEPNANHLFNAIHSSMRQWGSSLNHNGMSFFLATVPAGVSLYHGTWASEIVKGMEWLAFEPEHALVFARPDFKDMHQSRTSHGHDTQKPLFGPAPSTNQGKYGYLHTYVTKHPLHLLYIDGMSAGKTCNGTQDTQDTLLLNSTDPCPPVMLDFERGLALCSLAKNTWDGRIDGILRMEGGFEIILCDFAAHLERSQAVAVTAPAHFWNSGLLRGWEYVQAVSARYDGIGGDRVQVDYEHFVSAFAYPEIEGLFVNNVQSDYPMPRLQNASDASLSRVREDVRGMIMNKDWTSTSATRNWQAVADMVVERYSGILHRLHIDASLRGNSTNLNSYLGTILRPFIDQEARDATLESARCVANVLPSVPTTSTSLAHRTISTVANHTCTTLLSAYSLLSATTPHSPTSPFPNPLSHALSILDNLFAYLAWTIWKQCRGCKDEEVCWIPMWPMGSHEDHASPRCLGEQDAKFRVGYWGGNFRGGRPGDDWVTKLTEELGS